MIQFGDFKFLCTNVPSYPWCNLFYRQFLISSNKTFLHGVSSSPSTAPVGINPTCSIPPIFAPSTLAHSPVLGNIANIIVCALNFLFVLYLIYLASRRTAAVGRVEFCAFLVVYAVSLPLQILTTGGVLRQGEIAIVVATAMHAGTVAAMFCSLVGNAVVAMQFVEDGTWHSLLLYFVTMVGMFGLTVTESLLVGFSRGPPSTHSLGLFIFLNVWPVLAAIIFFILMTYVVLRVLRISRPMYWYTYVAFLFVLSQLVWILLGKVLCEFTSARIDSSFIATGLETSTVTGLYIAWKGITEEQDEYDANN